MKNFEKDLNEIKKVLFVIGILIVGCELGNIFF